MVTGRFCSTPKKKKLIEVPQRREIKVARLASSFLFFFFPQASPSGKRHASMLTNGDFPLQSTMCRFGGGEKSQISATPCGMAERYFACEKFGEASTLKTWKLVLPRSLFLTRRTGLPVRARRQSTSAVGIRNIRLARALFWGGFWSSPLGSCCADCVLTLECDAWRGEKP